MDYTGFVFGNIKVLKRADGDLEKCRKHLKERGTTSDPVYTCECLLCGKIFDRRIYTVKYGKHQNCGCKSLEYDLTDKRFDKVVAIRPLGLNNHKEMVWECKCDCGNITNKTSYQLRKGQYNQCKDCAKQQISIKSRKYMLSLNTKENNEIPENIAYKDYKKLYSIYTNVKTRCYNQNNENFNRYGIRGVVMCDEWLNDFQKFYDWAISNGFDKNLTLDRIDNNGNYEPSNCRWADRRTQSNNRRTNRIIEYNGETDTMANWSRKLNIPYYYIQYRINKGKQLFEVVYEFNNNTRHTRKKITS